MSADVLELSSGFPAVFSRDARVLVLGSLPGRASLAASQYYAQPRNAFWTIMDTICGAGPGLEYERRLGRLRDAGIALWDVLAAAHRPGSLDASINTATMQVNDFGSLFAHCDGLRLIAFNGRKAAQLFERHVSLPSGLEAVERVLLPSTSPAYAAMTLREKSEVWMGSLAPVLSRS